MNGYNIRHGLVVEGRISLLNRLSAFYNMSEFFFSLNRDTVRTANDHNVSINLENEKLRQEHVISTAEKIREICDKLKLLDIVSTDNGNVIRKKTLLRRRLLMLTRNLTETTQP